MKGLKSSDRTIMHLDIKTYALSLGKHYITLSHFMAYHSKEFLWNIRRHINSWCQYLLKYILKEYLKRILKIIDTLLRSNFWKNASTRSGSHDSHSFCQSRRLAFPGFQSRKLLVHLNLHHSNGFLGSCFNNLLYSFISSLDHFISL